MQKPYGTWPSPVSAPLVAAHGLRLSSVGVHGNDVYWIEGRPAEAGRNVLVRREPNGRTTELTPAAFNVRTRAHEYGGGAYLVDGTDVYFCNYADQRIYRVGIGGSAQREAVGGSVEPDPPSPVTPSGEWFYADLIADRLRRRLIGVREDHSREHEEPVTTLVGVPLDGEANAGVVLKTGADFYSTPRLSPDGSQLAWLSWRHPQMPWDGTELWVAELSPTGALENAVLVAGGTRESIYQPGWSPDGTLYFVSDRDGWWRLFRSDRSSRSTVREVLANPPDAAEFGRPQWTFGTATWAFAGPSRMVVSYTTAGHWRLATVDVASGRLSDLPTALEPQDWVAATSTHAVLVAASPTSADAVVRIDLDSGAVETIRDSSTARLDSGYISVPEAIEFPTADGERAHAFYYPPQNKDCTPPAGERPPLVVISHGGPTTATSATLALKVQFWTSRGFAVVDVNYGGSSGYGRAYRDRLNGRWGIVDVHDVVDAATSLVRAGKADPHRLIIRGGSAGGYTALAALTFHPGAFHAGASYYGICDLEVLAHDTHKFEARYLDTLIGPYPSMRDEYRARSPIYFVNRLSCALILFQGLDDKVVPPNQSEMMAAAVRVKGLPVSYLAFEGEQHGFRKAETIVRSLEAELYFYGKVFRFDPADAVAPVPIDNLSA